METQREGNEFVHDPEVNQNLFSSLVDKVKARRSVWIVPRSNQLCTVCMYINIYTYIYIFIILACNFNLLHLQLIPGLCKHYQCLKQNQFPTSVLSGAPSIQAHSCSSLGRSNPIVVTEETSFGDWCLCNLDWYYDDNVNVSYFWYLHSLLPQTTKKKGGRSFLPFVYLARIAPRLGESGHCAVKKPRNLFSTDA